MKPKWRFLAKLCRWSTQIPVSVATSESVKIFWLAFTVTMALASFWTRRFYDGFNCARCWVYRISCHDIRAIVVPFHKPEISRLVLLFQIPMKPDVFGGKAVDRGITSRKK